MDFLKQCHEDSEFYQNILEGFFIPFSVSFPRSIYISPNNTFLGGNHTLWRKNATGSESKSLIAGHQHTNQPVGKYYINTKHRITKEHILVERHSLRMGSSMNSKAWQTKPLNLVTNRDWILQSLHHCTQSILDYKLDISCSYFKKI